MNQTGNFSGIAGFAAAGDTRLWRSRRLGQGCIAHWRGHPLQDVSAAIVTALETAGDGLEEVCRVLKDLRGHFALVVELGDGSALAAVDHTRSIPLFFAKAGQSWRVDHNANRLREQAGLDAGHVRPDSHLAVAMSGSTFGARTLYAGLEVLVPGELVLFRNGETPRRAQYSSFRSWLCNERGAAQLKRELKEVTLGIFERMFENIRGRCLVVPLSAGYDSRLIVALAKHMGHKDVLCFTYGRPGNFEAAASAGICARLGYEWNFVPSSITTMRRYFRSGLHTGYLDFADDATCVPFVQDLFALDQLRQRSLLPDDAVVVNGQSGDFISGNHIPKDMTGPDNVLAPDQRRRRIVEAYIAKHCSLWQALKTPGNLDRIGALIGAEIDALATAGGTGDVDHGIYESIEFVNRQSKYVVSGQRAYDYLGLDWRLPLWDADYLDFWQDVPRQWKLGQKLYIETIEDADWAGVWHGLPVNRKTVRPLWLAAVRTAAKAACAPFGKARWREFEHKYLQYWMEVTCHTAAVSYSTWSRDKRGARNTMSWLTEAFLARHDLVLDPQHSNERV